MSNKFEKDFQKALVATSKHGSKTPVGKKSKQTFESDQDDELIKALANEGIEFYDGNPHVDVKIQYLVRSGPKVRAILRKIGNDELLERAYETAQEDWWSYWKEGEGADLIKKAFGKSASAGAVGRSGGHFIINVDPWAFTSQADDDEAYIHIDHKKVAAWTKIEKMIEKSISPSNIDSVVANQIEYLAEDLQEIG
jgi:hypothetical protein